MEIRGNGAGYTVMDDREWGRLMRALRLHGATASRRTQSAVFITFRHPEDATDMVEGMDGEAYGTQFGVHVGTIV